MCNVSIDSVDFDPKGDISRYLRIPEEGAFGIRCDVYSPCDQDAVLVADTTEVSSVTLEYRDDPGAQEGPDRGNTVRKRVRLSTGQNDVAIRLAALGGGDFLINAYVENDGGQRLCDDIDRYDRLFLTTFQ